MRKHTLSCCNAIFGMLLQAKRPTIPPCPTWMDPLSDEAKDVREATAIQHFRSQAIQQANVINSGVGKSQAAGYNTQAPAAGAFSLTQQAFAVPSMSQSTQQPPGYGGSYAYGKTPEFPTTANTASLPYQSSHHFRQGQQQLPPMQPASASPGTRGATSYGAQQNSTYSSMNPFSSGNNQHTSAQHENGLAPKSIARPPQLPDDMRPFSERHYY